MKKLLLLAGILALSTSLMGASAKDAKEGTVKVKAKENLEQKNLWISLYKKAAVFKVLQQPLCRLNFSCINFKPLFFLRI